MISKKYTAIISIIAIALLLTNAGNSYATEYEVTVVKIAPNNSSSTRTNVYFDAKDGSFTDKNYSCNDHELAVVLFALANNSKLYVDLNSSGFINSVYILMD